MAAGATYVPIATQTLGSTATTITFSSIPSTYTDLVLVANARTTQSGSAQGAYLSINGDTGSNYSITDLQGNGSSATSYRAANLTQYAPFGTIPAASTSSSTFGIQIVNFMNYSNTTTYKNWLSRSGDTTLTEAIIGLWRSTAAITSIQLVNAGINNWAVGSTFTLYGIASA